MRGEHPHATELKKVGRKEEPKKKRMVAKHSMFFRRDQIPRA